MAGMSCQTILNAVAGDKAKDNDHQTARDKRNG